MAFKDYLNEDVTVNRPGWTVMLNDIETMHIRRDDFPHYIEVTQFPSGVYSVQLRTESPSAPSPSGLLVAPKIVSDHEVEAMVCLQMEWSESLVGFEGTDVSEDRSPESLENLGVLSFN